MKNFDVKILARYANAALGVWLMFAPAVLSYGPPAQTNDRIAGPLIIAFAVIAIWETTRPLRRMNTVLGTWLLLAPWVLSFGTAATLNSLIVGVLTILFSLVKGRVAEEFGGGWSVLWQSPQKE